MQSFTNREIVGIGTPVVDHIFLIEEEAVQKMPGGKGGMLLISANELEELLASDHCKKASVFGGSCANTLKGLASLGRSCALIGAIGTDNTGALFEQALRNLGITPFLLESALPTAQSICLITPDGERTMRTQLGAAVMMNESLLKQEMFEGAILVHIEGYSLLQGALTEHAMAMAKQSGALVSIDLSSYEVVKQEHSRLTGLIDSFADIVIANADEAWELTGLPPKEACAALRKSCSVAIVLFGAGGCWVGAGGKLIHGPAFPAHPVDTTGAGDVFAAGFIHAFLDGLSLSDCAKAGALAGSAVVRRYGAELSKEDWEAIKTYMKPYLSE